MNPKDPELTENQTQHLKVNPGVKIYEQDPAYKPS
jgi:hypothetical protein